MATIEQRMVAVRGEDNRLGGNHGRHESGDYRG